MKTITVSASKNYPILIGENLLQELGNHVLNIKCACKAAIISDSNVFPIYGKAAVESLETAGFSVVHYIFAAGESSKNAEVYFSVLNFLAENHLTRSDLVIALGGGVVGDMTGFAAATYLRGISYIQIPTSLLAMVDSSVGGKTAIDLPAGKNLVGAFYQPSLVICDTSVLSTLPPEIFRDGCAEVIKYGILYDEVLFSHLLKYGLEFDREKVIAQCVALKRDVVMEDEFDTGSRQKLNFGHTIGHGIEACSDYTISHGQAVAIGMAIVSKAAHKFSFCSREAMESIFELLKIFGLPTQTAFPSELLYGCALSDKKRTGSSVNLILPVQIGNCIIHPMKVEELQSFIEAGL